MHFRQFATDAIYGTGGVAVALLLYFDGRITTSVANLGSQLERVETRMEAEMDKSETKMGARFEKVDARFEKIDARFEKFEAKMDAGFDKVLDKPNGRRWFW